MPNTMLGLSHVYSFNPHLNPGLKTGQMIADINKTKIKSVKQD